jgi:hypothetical protein
VSDQRLRECERRFRETGAVEDEANWLRARVRVGDLDARRLELLAVIDYPAAICVLGAYGFEQRCVPMWKRDLAGFGREVCGWTIVIAAELWCKHSDRKWFTEWLDATLPLARAFLEESGPESEAAFGRGLGRYLGLNENQTWQSLRAEAYLAPVHSLALAIYSVLHGDATAWVDPALRVTVPVAGSERLEDTVREELARWALAGR